MASTSTWTYDYVFHEVPSSGATPYTANAHVTLTTGAPDANGIYTVLSASGMVDGSAIVGLDSGHGENNTLSLVTTSFGMTVRMDGVDGSGVGFTLADGRTSELDYNNFYNTLFAGVDVPRIRYPTLGKVGVGSFTTTACYVRGTAIMTAAGAVPVEMLAIGDLLVTASGAIRPLQWVGRRSYAGRFLAGNPGAQPVRFHAGSLGGGLPVRDLLVSPEHAMLLDGLLIPARCLVNAMTILCEPGLQRVDYFHVELDSHDAVLAEGAASETFLDDDSRSIFHNASEFAALYPDKPFLDGYCAPRVEAGAELEAVRQRLQALARAMAAA